MLKKYAAMNVCNCKPGFRTLGQFHYATDHDDDQSEHFSNGKYNLDPRS